MRVVKIFHKEYSGKKRKFGIFICKYCGNKFESLSTRDDTPLKKSCGCYTNELRKHCTHKKSNHKLYRVWVAMRDRCNNKTNKGYKNYGERGISVCREWKDDFMSFYRWSMENGYEKGKSIDRINNDKGYSPDNCRYTTPLIQNCNRRNFNKYGFFGVAKHREKYLAHISIKNKKRHIGSFDTIKEAALARDVFVLLNNLPNQLNFKEYKCF